MSGPITVLVHPGLALPVMLAAAAIRAARAVQQASANAAALHDARADQRRADGVRQSAAQQQGEAALQAQAAAAEQRLAQLATLSAQWGGGQALEVARPQRPESADVAALAAYVRGLEAFADEAQRQLMTVWAGQPAAAGEGHGLEALLLAAAQAVPTALQRPSERFLARIAHLGPVPADLQVVAQELDQTREPVRAELLATELRRRVQLHAQAALADEVQRAQALVMEQSLMDLGYQVDGIESTLFVEGGVAHFRKSHWGEYMVRMRVADAGRSINFNVVRAVAGAQAGAAAEGLSVQDHLAEDRWCAEFPALLKALAARGMQLDVTRRLEAGELPVQRVRRDQLPRFAEAEADAVQSAAPALARPLP